ncbi:MAG: site-2 protease family protein [Defluviitaleaceae bacterium]|nr:site-2 protease family protein [Defluviitaleaceae bacterium]
MILTSSPLEIVILLPALIIAFTIHELCHGLAAYGLGDSTAKRDGRLSINPIRHIDPLGLIFILVAGFGWAKPVMVNPHNLKNPKVDMALIAIAGPLSNFIMAFVSLMIFVPLLYFWDGMPPTVIRATLTFAQLNIVLGVFNLIPIPPLDGSKVIAGILPERIYRALPPVGRYGMLVLLVLMLLGFTGRILSPIVEAVMTGFISIAYSIYSFLIF